MKAYEFLLNITKEGKPEIDPALLKILPKNQKIRGILLVEEAMDKKFRSNELNIQQQEFSYGFGPQEAVYDDF